MADNSSALTKSELASVCNHFKRLLASDTMIQANRLRRFLEYVVAHQLSGGTGRLSQYSIAIDVFDRDETFDPTVDPIVRVEAGRLRSKLREYYDEEGRDDPVRISLPKHGYVAKFQLQHQKIAAVDNDPAYKQVASKFVKSIRALNPTIAVLPFDNMSADPEQDYFSDGITEDLITDLSRMPGLSVIARQSTFAYRGVATSVQEVSKTLGAEFIVEGSVRKIGSRIRINVQLIHGETGKHVWAERFDREIDDIFALQDSVNRKILDALRLQISTQHQSRLQQKGTEIVEAYDYVLRGMKETQARTREASATARYCFRSAIDLDPGYATAYGRMGLNAIYQWIAGWNSSRKETVERGLELAKKAVQLDRQNSFAFAALCWALLWTDEHDAAIEAGQEAIELDPNDVTALERLALALAWSNRAEDALKHLEKAHTLNPLSSYNFPNAVCFFSLERYPDAVDFLHSSINASPAFLPAYLYLAASLSLLGQEEAAKPVVETIMELDPGHRLDQSHPATFKHKQDRERFFGALTRVFDS